jgi:hypothetical protein
MGGANNSQILSSSKTGGNFGNQSMNKSRVSSASKKF